MGGEGEKAREGRGEGAGLRTGEGEGRRWREEGIDTPTVEEL